MVTKEAEKSTDRRRPAGGKANKLPADEPLALWRTARANGFNDATASLLREALVNVYIIKEPAWPAAAKGDASAAIGLALRLWHEDAGPNTYDLVMTALAACAAEDRAGACLAMSYALRRWYGAGRAQDRIAASWFKRSVIKAHSEEAGELH
jgi:hypothetical protein